MRSLEDGHARIRMFLLINTSYVSADAIWSRCWYKLGGYVHTSAPAPIGSRRVAHLSVHAQYESSRNIGVRRMYTDIDADIQRAKRTIGVMQPSCITTYSQQSPWRQVQGGVVDCGGPFPMAGGLGVREHCVALVSYNKKYLFVYCERMHIE